MSAPLCDYERLARSGYVAVVVIRSIRERVRIPVSFGAASTSTRLLWEEEREREGEAEGGGRQREKERERDRLLRHVLIKRVRVAMGAPIRDDASSVIGS